MTVFKIIKKPSFFYSTPFISTTAQRKDRMSSLASDSFAFISVFTTLTVLHHSSVVNFYI